jgi:hypothetical protein
MVTGLLSTILILSCLPSALLDFAMPKWKVDPNVRIEDAYKWIYQATRGGEHAAPDREMAKRWLDKEWTSLGKPAKNEPLWEPLCKDNSIGRLNLRAFKAKGGKMDDILDAFLTSSREFKETGTNFLDTWSDLGKRLTHKAIGSLTFDEWSRLDADEKAKHYPAIHHSATFEAAEYPAYRIITKAQKNWLIKALK